MLINIKCYHNLQNSVCPWLLIYSGFRMSELKGITAVILVLPILQSCWTWYSHMGTGSSCWQWIPTKKDLRVLRESLEGKNRNGDCLSHLKSLCSDSEMFSIWSCAFWNWEPLTLIILYLASIDHISEFIHYLTPKWCEKRIKQEG